MRIILPLLMVLFLAGCQKPVTFLNVPEKAELYTPVFVDFNITKQFNNPFDRNEVAVDALIIGEKGDTIVLPCFYYVGDSASHWQMRFTPRHEGAQSVQVRVVSGGQTSLSDAFQLTVAASSKRGLLSFDKSNPYFFKADNGEKVRGLGMNVGWEFEPKWDSKPKYTYEHYLTQMNQNGANFLRVWICPWNMPIEWSPVPSYPILFENFDDKGMMHSISEGFQFKPGQTNYTQADINQLIKTGKGRDSIVYKIDSLRAVKMMVYYREKLNKDHVKMYSSIDGTTFNEVAVSWSDHWGSADKWERIFLYNSEELPQPTNFVKLVFDADITADNTVFAGIQFRNGNAESVLDCDGLSRYSAKNSIKLDNLVELASSKQMYMMLCFQYHGVFNPIMDSWGANDEWQRNPYNVKNGGPCEKPADFFSNPVAMDHYKNFLRYMVARWGYSDAIAVWELWNEILDHDNLANWHREMSDYLYSVDPYKHIVSTSIMHGHKYDDIWNMPNIHLTQTHRYHPSAQFVEKTVEYINKFGKPHCIGEYAVDWKGPGYGYSDTDYENEFRYGMWRGLISPVAILPMSWWWDYHMELGQFAYFKPLSLVIDEMQKQAAAPVMIEITQPKGFEVIGVKTDKASYVWALKKEKATKTDMVIPVPAAGNYNVRLLNTKTAAWSDLGQFASVDGTVTAKSINFGIENDLAIVLSLVD
jgi:hypothetical protein